MTLTLTLTKVEEKKKLASRIAELEVGRCSGSHPTRDSRTYSYPEPTPIPNLLLALALAQR